MNNYVVPILKFMTISGILVIVLFNLFASKSTSNDPIVVMSEVLLGFLISIGCCLMFIFRGENDEDKG